MKKNNSFVILPIGFIALILALILYIIYFESDFAFTRNSKTIDRRMGNTISNQTNNQQAGQTKTDQTATQVNLNVPFSSQAPGGDWSYPFEHTCEEVSVLMVHYYLKGKTFGDVNETRQELLDIVNFENQKYGFSNDTDTEQTAIFARDYYGYNVETFYNITLDDIKRELKDGNPVIVPTAGRLLGNPNFTGLGPIYHMLVIKGYTSDEFITNDGGTRNGANYRYSYKVLKNAIHDWNKGDILNGRSAMIVIKK